MIKKNLKFIVSIVLNVCIILVLIVSLFKRSGTDDKQFVTPDQLQASLRIGFDTLSKSLSQQISDRFKPMDQYLKTATNKTAEASINNFKYVPRGYDFCLVNQEPVLFDNHFNYLFKPGDVCPFAPDYFIDEIGKTYLVLSSGEVYIRDTRNSYIMEGMASLAGKGKE